MRIGVFGGSFDPIHYGHLILAEQCREQAKLDRVIFVPSRIAPHKQYGSSATERQRVDMLRLAIAGHPAFDVSLIEIDRGGVSYTVDTLNELRKIHPEDLLFLLMGDDSLQDFCSWKEPGHICQLAILLVAARPGNADVDLNALRSYLDEARFELFKNHMIHNLLIEISSSDIRRRVRESKSIRFLLPRAVEKYIETQKLYVDNQALFQNNVG